MSKPDWKDAPEWAKHLAMDEDGTWCWYEQEPYLGECAWFSDGRYEFVYPGRWDESLEGRPAH